MPAEANLFAINQLHARVCTSPLVGTIVMHAHQSHSTRHFAAERHSADVAQWARLEGKSETMSADLISASTTSEDNALAVRNGICRHCFTSATIGAAVALLVERLMLGD